MFHPRVTKRNVPRPPPRCRCSALLATSRKGWVFQCFGSTNEGRGGCQLWSPNTQRAGNIQNDGLFGKVGLHEKILPFLVYLYMLDFQCVRCVWENPWCQTPPKKPMSIKLQRNPRKNRNRLGYRKGVLPSQDSSFFKVKVKVGNNTSLCERNSGIFSAKHLFGFSLLVWDMDTTIWTEIRLLVGIGRSNYTLRVDVAGTRWWNNWPFLSPIVTWWSPETFERVTYYITIPKRSPRIARNLINGWQSSRFNWYLRGDSLRWQYNLVILN